MEPQAAMGGWGMLTVLLWAVVIIVPFWKISIKAGYSGWLALLLMVPIVNVIYLYFLAFSHWPSRRDER